MIYLQGPIPLLAKPPPRPQKKHITTYLIKVKDQIQLTDIPEKGVEDLDEEVDRF